jgi:hypothetical protein
MNAYEHAVLYILGIPDFHVWMPHEQCAVGRVVNVEIVDGRIHACLSPATIKTPVGEIPFEMVWVEVSDWSYHGPSY